MRYLIALVLVGCASSTPDTCADLRAQGACNQSCAQRYRFDDPAYGPCLGACATQYHDHTQDRTECFAACPDATCRSGCTDRYPYPPSGCFADAGPDAS
jgi:hypothetical protein